MNRIYKVIWNEALNCFTAVGEYAKGHGKSSKSSVSANTTISTTSRSSTINTLRLSAIALGLITAGFGMQASAVGTENHYNGNYSHSHGSHGVHSHTAGNNSHNNSGQGNPGSSIALKFEGDNATTITRSNGETLNILGGATGALTNGNIGVFGIGDTLTVKLAEDLTGLESTTFNSGIVISSTGINAGNKKITNVDNGLVSASSKEAINGSQLHSLTNTVAANKTKYYSVNSTASGNANNDGATGPNAMAMGGNASATGGQAIAIGSGQSGQNTVASGQQSIAIGANVVSTGHSSIAIGGDDLDDASKANIDGTSVSTLNGGDVNTTFFSYTGRDLVETPRYKVNTESGGAASIAIGAKSLSEGALSTAVGVQSSSSGVASSAFGIGASASEKGSVALGAGSVANVAGGAIGYDPTGNDNAAIIATQSGASYGAVSIGTGEAGGTRQIVNVAAGTNDSDAVNVSQLKALDAVVADIDFPIRSSNAQPYTTSVTGTDALAVGSNANASGNNSTVIGENAFGTGNATVIGEGARSSFNGFAGGQDAKAGVNSVAIGQRATNGNASRAVAIGYEAKATAQDTVALGLGAQAKAQGGMALGKGASANALNSVSLGQNSVAALQSGASFLTNVAADANNGTVSVGAVGSERRIINVAGGSADTDAVNVSQLKAVADIANEGWDISAQGDSTTASTVEPGDSVDFNSKNSNITVSKTANSNDVSFELNNNLDLGNNGSVEMGSSSPFGLGSTTTLDRSGLTTGNSYFSTTVDGLGVRTGNALASTTVNGLGVFVNGPLGIPSTALTGNGLTIIGGPSVTRSGGINAGNKKIVNVDNGDNPNDAVNVSQLNSSSAAARTKVVKGTNVASVDFSTDINTGQDVYTVNANGTKVSEGSSAVEVSNTTDGNNLTDYAVDLSDDSKASLGKADSAMQTVVTQIDGDEVKTLDQADNTANFLTGKNIVLTEKNGDIEVATAAIVDFTSVTTGDTLLNTGGVSFLSGSSVRLSSTGLNNGGNRITEVGDAIELDDAVNLSQLNSVTETANRGWDISAQGDSATASTVEPGDSVDFNSKNSNIIVSKDSTSNDVSFELNNDLDLGNNGSVTTGNILGGTQVNRFGIITGGIGLGGVTTVSGAGVKVIGTNPLSKATLTSDGLSIFNGPSITKSGGVDAAHKKVVNVSNGDVTATSKDAINGSQLFDTNKEIAKGIKFNVDGLERTYALGQTIGVTTDDNIDVTATADGAKFGLANVINIGMASPVQVDGIAGTISGLTNTTFDPNTAYTGGQAATQEQLNDLNDGINTAVKKGLNFDGDTGMPVNRQLGEKLTIKGGATTALSDNNIGVDADGSDTLNIKLAKDLTGLTSVTTGDTLLNTGGVSFLGGSTVRLSSTGLDNGGNQITNVASGVGDEFNAANIGDVNRASSAARTEVVAGTNVASVMKSTGGNEQDVYTVNANGVTASAGSAAITVTAGETDDTTNVTDYAVDLSDDSKASLVRADSAMQTLVAQIDGENVQTLTKTDNIANFISGENIILTDDGGIRVATKDDVTFTSVSFTDSTVRLSNEGLDNGGNRITEVADGDEDTDAVNVRQLNATNSTVDLGLNFTGDDTAVTVNRKLGQTLTIKGGATELTDNNIGVVADEDGNLNVKLAEDVRLGRNGSVRMESTVLNNAGITITDGPNETITLSNEGLDNGNNRIIKVDKGVAPTDAVNFAQLTMTNDEIAKGIRVGDGNSNNDQQFALGDTINVTGDSNITTTASATGVAVQLNNQLDLGDDGSVQIGNSIMNNAGFTFIDSGLGRTVTLSSRGLDNGGNPISNVGRGELNSDAVNVGQLREVTIALDRGWDITAQGDIATQVRQGDAIDLNSRDGNIKVSRTLVNDTATLDANTGLRAAAVPANANDISFDLNPDISLDSVTTGDTTISDNGLTITDGPSITKSGIDAADNKVINVQNGEVSATSQDAINGSQLYTQGVGVSSIIGGGTVYNAESGTFTNSDIGGTGQSNIDGAIASIRQGTIEINESVQVNTTSIATNSTSIATNTTNIANNASNITTNTTNIETNTDRLDAGLSFGADSGDDINKPVGDSSVLSFTGGSNITTTAEGSSIKFDLNGNISVDSVTAGTTVINSNGISMQDGPSMTAQGLYAGNQRMTGVADGVEATDAVNYSQLSALDSRLGRNMSDLGYKIDEVEDDANAGISAAMAMSSLPQAYISGKSLIGGGIGTYNGESAVAIGFSKLSNDGRWVIKVNGTADTQGNVGGAVGAGFHFD